MTNPAEKRTESTSTIGELLAKLNVRQCEAVTHGRNPLLIVAGAGTGKTTTLVHRVAWLISQGVEPSRILLLTFSRRAAAEMLRRADSLVRKIQIAPPSPAPSFNSAEAKNSEEANLLFDDEPFGALSASTSGHVPVTRVWSGTFHAVSVRLLRRFGKAIGLPEDFSVHDRTDSEDLMNVLRTELNLAKTDKRFPKKGTCVDIYSRCVNARMKLEETLATVFPWCRQWADDLKKLFDAYVDRKEKNGVLDYDDLLLYWRALLADEAVGPRIRRMFDCVLVDEYQDTNVLQADILKLLTPEGDGLTVVGDDAQSIYSFRAATIRNILDFPKDFPAAKVIKLEENYRSVQPILDATNRVIGLAKERYEKNLIATRIGGRKPQLVHCEDESDQAEFVIRKILEHREEGVDLSRQAVLFRASHHSMLLEAELARREIPFHKYGGLKFAETAHVKDLLGFLRLADNPLDMVAGTRVLPLLPGVGPKKARQLMDMLGESGGDFVCWTKWRAPADAAEYWEKLTHLMRSLSASKEDLASQLNRVRVFYEPLLETHYDNPAPRLRDLEQLELIASRYRNRRRMLLELTLDPPNSTQDFAGKPDKDDDCLVLSTIHSAKGLEWDATYVIHVSDGNIPSDMATGKEEEIEEERRLFYVALTRAKNWLYVCFPLRYYSSFRSGDFNSFAQRTRFLPSAILDGFDQRIASDASEEDAFDADLTQERVRTHSRDVRRAARDLWS